MLQNAYLFAKFGADTAENEPHFVMKDWQEGRGPTKMGGVVATKVAP